MMNDDDDDDDYDAMHPHTHPYARPPPQIKDDNPFIGTLDYIFLSKEWRVESVLPTAHRDTVKYGPYPNKMEPSDHIMIAADLLFPDERG